MSKHNRTNPRAIIFVLVVILAAAFVVFMKTSTNNPFDRNSADGSAAAGDSAAAPMAVPDTTISTDVMPIVSDSVAPAVLDSLSRDPRPADEAGAEDGYWNGYYDGVAGKEAAEPDVTSNFPTRAERDAYAANYTDGYARGYAEGCKGKSSPEAKP